MQELDNHEAQTCPVELCVAVIWWSLAACEEWDSLKGSDLENSLGCDLTSVVCNCCSPCSGTSEDT